MLGSPPCSILMCFTSVSLSLLCLLAPVFPPIIVRSVIKAQSLSILRKLNIKHHLFPSDLNVGLSQSRNPPQNICDCIHGYHPPSNKENALLHYCIVPHVRARNEMRAADKNHPSTVVSSDVTRFCQNKKHNLTRLPLVAGSAFAISESLRMFLNQKKDSIFRVIPPDLVCVCVCFFY